MGLQAYGVCPSCAELYPAARGCPSCDGDVEAATFIQTARVAHVVGAKRDDNPHRPLRVVPRQRAGRNAVIVAAFGLSVLVGSLLLAALQA